MKHLLSLRPGSRLNLLSWSCAPLLVECATSGSVLKWSYHMNLRWRQSLGDSVNIMLNDVEQNFHIYPVGTGYFHISILREALFVQLWLTKSFRSTKATEHWRNFSLAHKRFHDSNILFCLSSCYAFPFSCLTLREPSQPLEPLSPYI